MAGVTIVLMSHSPPFLRINLTGHDQPKKCPRYDVVGFGIVALSPIMSLRPSSSLVLRGMTDQNMRLHIHGLDTDSVLRRQYPQLNQELMRKTGRDEYQSPSRSSYAVFTQVFALLLTSQ